MNSCQELCRNANFFLELSKDNTECTVTNMESVLSQCKAVVETPTATLSRQLPYLSLTSAGCPVGSCNVTGRQTGMLDPGSLDVRINYTAPMKANIIVTWTYKTGESHFVATDKTLVLCTAEHVLH